LAGVRSIFLVRKNRFFLNDILLNSNVVSAKIVRADGLYYLFSTLYVWLLCLVKKVFIINSFHFTCLRLPTRIFYRVAKKLSANIIICKKEIDPVYPYKQIIYHEGENIWQRNNRIVVEVGNAAAGVGFPVLDFGSVDIEKGDYLHLHPVGSRLEKSYPAAKLVKLLKLFDKSQKVVITLTPNEGKWYLAEELVSYVDSQPNLTLIVKHFSFKEIKNLIAGASVFCTVNTGLLWVGIMLGKKVVVCDTFTDFEWNPQHYGPVKRIVHSHDEQGNSLHLKLVKHQDGEYYESMYRITPSEIYYEISALLNG